MPTYHARGVTVQIKVSPLQPTITENPSFNRGAGSRTLYEDAIKSLNEGQVLPELPIPSNTSSSSTPTNDNSHDQTGYSNFLGPEQNVPFYLRCVLYPNQPPLSHRNEASTDKGSNPEESAQTPPYAFSVHVTPSREGPTKHTSFLPQPKSAISTGLADIMISVYLNGKLANTTVIRFVGSFNAETLPRTFSGVRFAWLHERPWVIFSSKGTFDELAGDIELPDADDTSAELRWNAISAELAKEAEKYGYNEDGDVQPLRGYLESLAALPMPDAVKGLQKPQGLKYAVIDVAMALGKGRKGDFGRTYIRTPVPLIDPDFPYATREAVIYNEPLASAGAVTAALGESSTAPQAGASAKFVPTADPTPPLKPVPRTRDLRPANAPQFVVPELCKGSIIGFEDPDRHADIKSGLMGIIRHVAPEMEGTFVQSGMLLAVRYVVSTESL